MYSKKDMEYLSQKIDVIVMYDTRLLNTYKLAIVFSQSSDELPILTPIKRIFCYRIFYTYFLLSHFLQTWVFSLFSAPKSLLETNCII